MLRAEFGESKEDKCRRLANELSAIKQEETESVEEFSFRFKRLLHQLEKLGEKIGKDCPTFVMSQFISRVNHKIAQWCVVKAGKFLSLDKAVEAARRVELSFVMVLKVNKECSLDEWKVLTPNAFLSSTASQSTSQTHRKTCYNCGDASHVAKFCP